MKWSVIVLSVSLVGCDGGKKDSSDDPDPGQKPAACKVVNKLFESENFGEREPILACYDHESSFTVSHCETMSTLNTSEGIGYELFEGQSFCPGTGLIGLCDFGIHESTKEHHKVWIYETDLFENDNDRIQTFCENHEGAVFTPADVDGKVFE